MVSESTHLHFFLISCLANTSIETFLFWCSPKPFSNIKLHLPAALPPHQVSNSIPVSQESFAWSHFLCSILSNGLLLCSQPTTTVCFLSKPLSLFLPYYFTIWVFITNQYWNFSTFQPSPPRSLLPPFQWDDCFHASRLNVCSPLLPPSWTRFESYTGTSSPGK